MAVLLMPLVSAFSASSTDNVVVYWGQNSAGSQQRLATYCQDSTIDIIPISFLVAFGTGAYQINFANMCGGTPIAGSSLVQCDQIAEDIKTCQAAGKKILLSMGGASGAYGFSSAAQATQTANDLWNYFGGGSSSIRPFGTSNVDGFDLDIENNNPAYYPEFIAQMRTNYASQSARTYYIAGAPQCVYPDASLANALADSYFDFLFIQFYNNYCGLYQYGSSTNAFNYATWDTWAKQTSKNKNVRLYLGVAAATGAANAGTGYVAPSVMIQAAKDLKSQYSSTFGGIMMWDASQAYANVPSGYSINYAQIAKQALTGAITPVTPATTATTSSSSSVAAGNVAAPATTAPAATQSPVTSGACTQSYTVVSGDSCYAIWTRFNLPSSTFYSLNPSLSAANNCPIQPGQVLCVSNTGAGSGTTTIQVTSTSTTTVSLPSPAKVRPTVKTNVKAVRPAAATLTPGNAGSTGNTDSTSTTNSVSGGSCPVSGASCAAGSYQCNGYGYAQCVNGAWMLRNCAAGTACAGSGSNIYCDFPGSAAVTCSGIAGKTNSKRDVEADDLPAEVETSITTQRINATHFLTTLKAKAVGIAPITEWEFSFESDKHISATDQGVLHKEEDGTYTVSSNPLDIHVPTRSLQVRLTGQYEAPASEVPSRWLW